MKKLKDFFRDVNVRVVLTNGFMALAVVVIAGVMLLATMGYGIKVGEEVRIERVGMLQIRSIPSRATIYIDGEKTSYRTDWTRTIPEGEYDVELKKDGYVSWKRKIKIAAGMLSSFEYPRLFPVKSNAELVAESVIDMDFRVSPSRRRIFKLSGGSMSVIDIAGGKWTERKVELPREIIDLIAYMSPAWEGVSLGDVVWSEDEAGVFAQFVRIDGEGAVYKDYFEIDFYNSEETRVVEMGEMQVFGKGGYRVVLREFEELDESALVSKAGYFIERADSAEAVPVKCKMEFEPIEMFANYAGTLAVFRGEGGEFCVYDVAEKKSYDYAVGGVRFGWWLDDYMLWGVNDGGQLVVWDFDGENQRIVVTKSGGVRFATIAEGGRFLYYSVVGESGVRVFREKLY
jgi:hypothetical protein